MKKLIILLGVVGVSMSSLLVRWSQAPSLTLVVYRMGFASVLLIPWVLLRQREELRHLTIDYGGSSMLTIRLYNGEEYVTECEVDASVPRDVLNLNTQPVEEATERIIGTYQVKTVVQQNVSLSTLTLSVDAAEGASTYTLTYGEQGIYTTDPISIDEPFTYLTLLISSLEDVTVQLYDSGGNPLTQARFDVELQQIVAPIETEG